MRNIAFAGQMGAGKSTATDYLVENYGYNAAKISRPIYEIAEMLWGPEARKDRAKLQDLGMKMREIDPDVWINYYVEVTIGEALDGEGPYANDTMRFPNEYWALRNKGDFVTIRVNCPEAKRVDRLQKIGRIQDLDRLHHESETALFGARAESEGIHFDYEVDNDDDDPAKLYEELDAVIRHIEEEE